MARVGVFGNLGSGNIGNDASLEAILGFLASCHPDVAVDAMCGGADCVQRRYRIPAIPLYWSGQGRRGLPAAPAAAVKVVGKGVDIFRTAAWVRRHDAVIVPGMGVLEASLPLRPWGFPYALLLLSASGRLLGTKIALVSVGAGTINQRLTRRLFDQAARLASYRSYRNVLSRTAMRERGLDVTDDQVYPDLAFALPTPPRDPGDGRTVCVGVMDYHGSNDDRRSADAIHAAYLAAMKCFVRWLVDHGRDVRLVVGDTNGSDDRVVREIIDDVREWRPGMDPRRVTAEPVETFADVMRVMQPASAVVAIRFHNVVAALKLCKPTIAISYSPKHDALMEDMGMAGFSVPVASLGLDALVHRFEDLERAAPRIRERLATTNALNERLLAEQFRDLWDILFPSTPGDFDTKEGGRLVQLGKR